MPTDPVTGEERADEAEGVTEDGTPATPAAQAAEKQKQKQRTYVGIALAGVGIVVAIVLARKQQAAANAAAANQGAAGTITPNTTGGYVAGTGTDLSGLQSELGSLQQANSQTAAALAAQQQANNTAFAGFQTSLNKLLAELNSKGGTGPEQAAHFNSANYPQFQPGLSSNFDVFGRIQNGQIVGGNVGSSGAPVYALMNTGFGPIWEQDFNPANLPAGTEVGTPQQFAPYVNNPPAGYAAPNIFGIRASASSVGAGTGAPAQTSGTIAPRRPAPTLLRAG